MKGVSIGLLLFVVLGGVGAQERIPLEPGVVYGRLENGMRYYIQENSTPKNKVELRLVVNTGSILEGEDQQGMAHFLEHMAFNGTQGYAKNDIVRYMQSIGMQFGPDINAYTSFDETVYKLSVPLEKDEYLEKGLDILEQWAFYITLADEDIEEERGVVLEEWRASLGANERMLRAAYPDIMWGSPYGYRFPIGTEKSIRGSSPESIRRFYKDWYRPELMALIVVGDIEAPSMEEEIERRFGSYQNPLLSRERVEYPLPSHDETIYSVQSDPETTWTAATIINKGPRKYVRYREELRESFAEELYVLMFNKRLRDLAEGVAPPFIQAYVALGSSSRTTSGHSLTVLTGQNNFLQGYEALLIEEKRVLDYGFNPGELREAKERLRVSLQESYANRKNRESSALGRDYIRRYLEGVPNPGPTYIWEAFQDYEGSITLEDINSVAQTWLVEESRVVYAMFPEESRPADGALEAVAEGVKILTLEPLEDLPMDQSLMTDLPQEGKVVERIPLGVAGVEEWVLSNGARLYIKKTDFKEDEVLFSTLGPGGYSLVGEETYYSTRLASSLVEAGGVGGYSATELERLLAGSTAQLAPLFSDLSSATRGSSTWADLETLLQLNYLYFTDPNYAPENWSAYLERLAQSLEGRELNPYTQYSDLLVKILYQDHPRKKPLTAEMVRSVDLDEAYRFYQDRFRRSENFSFFLVGSLEEEELLPLVETYLASLPSGGGKEAWVDRGVLLKESRAEESITAGREPQSYVSMIYTGAWEWSPEETQIILAVADSLQMVMVDEIREKAAGAYSPAVYVDPSRIPQEQYYFVISFSCDPQRVEELQDLVKETIGKLQAGEFDDRIIADVIKAKALYLKERAEKNNYWLGRLERRFLLELPKEDILEENYLIDSYSREVFQERLKRYLREDSSIEVTLYPED